MQKVLKELFDQFVKKNGREPDNLEMILLRQKASTEEIRKRKIINMFDRSPVDANKPILGGQNIEETDTQILERLNKGNKESISNMKYENAVKAEEAKAAADEDYIMKVLDPEDFSKGGRAGYYGGGQAMVGEDLSEIGHGSDALMARNMQIAPGGQATTSTGLNYLLGEDNDTVRVPYNNGKKVKGPNPKVLELMLNEKMSYPEAEKELKMRERQQPYIDERYNMGPGPILEAAEGGRIGYNEGNMVLPKPKPNADPMVELLRVYNLYQESMPGVSQDTKKYLKEDFIQKLNDARISQEAFMTNRMQNNLADGGPARKGFKGGGGQIGGTSDMSGGSKSKSQSTNREKGIMSRGQGPKGTTKSTTTFDSGTGADDRSSPTQNINHFRAMYNAQQPKPSTLKNIFNTGSEINYLKNLYKMDPIGLGISYGINKFGPSIMEKFKNLRSQAELEEDQNGIMQMAELTEPQLGYLNSKKTQRDLKEGFLSPKQIYDKLPEYEEKTPLNPFKGDQEPTTPKEFNEYLDTIDKNKFLERITVAEGGPARQNFKMGKRAFLKLIGSGVAGIASLKTGLLDFTKGGGKKVAKEVAKEATGAPPAYFFKLVDKIRKLGDESTAKYATNDREVVTNYKDYTLTEDITTGEKTIQRFKDSEIDYYDEILMEETYMSYRPGKSQMDETTKGKTLPDEYTEDTSYLRTSGPQKGDILETVSGVSDDIFQEVGEEIPEIIRKEKADGGRIGYAGGKKVVDAIIKKVNKKSGKKAITTADKAEIPKETLLRDMFTDTNKRLNKKREMTVNEYEDFVEEVGGADQLEAYNFDGTVGDAERILKEQENRMKYMYDQYKMGKLDPVAGDKSPARKRFLEKKMEESLMSGDSKLMTREEIDELYNFDLGTEMDEMKKIKIDEDIDISQGMIDLDEMNFTKNAQAAKNKMDNMDVNQKIKEGVASIMSDTSPAALEKSIEIDNLMLKYPGMDKNLADHIASSPPTMKSDMIAMVEQTFKMDEMGMSGDDIIQTFKKTPRTKQATGGLASILG